MLRRSVTVAGASVAALALAAPAAHAVWAAQGTGTGRATAAALQQVTDVTTTATATTVTLAWKPPASGPAPTSYRVDRTSPDAASGVCAPSMNPSTSTWSCTDSGRPSSTAHSYVVVAVLAGWTGSTPAPTSTTAVTATTMSAGVAAGSATFSGSGSNRVWTVPVTVTVTDNLGNAVPGAAVTGGWTFEYSGSNTNNRSVGSTVSGCTTGTNGTCLVSISDAGSNVAKATYTVNGVSKSGLTWSQPTTATVSISRPF